MKEFNYYIFGSLYTFCVGTAKELGLEDKFSGDTDFHTKVIRIRTDVDECNEMGRDLTIIENTLRHEVFHAVLYETGLLDYCDDETLIGWFEVMFPKIGVILTNLGDKLGALDLLHT